MQTRRSRDEQNKLSQRQRTGCFQLGEFTFCYNECSAESSLDEVHDHKETFKILCVSNVEGRCEELARC